MTTTQTIQTIIDVILAAFAIWTLFNEDKFLILEDKIKAAFRRRKRT